VKNKIIVLIITIATVITIAIVISNKKNNNHQELQTFPISYEEPKNEGSIEDENKIKNIANEQGINVDTNIYDIKKEYDGREYISIKDSVKYNVVLSGIIKKEKPELNEIDELLTRAPVHTGIWIEENSRDTFLEIIKQITNANYIINEEGFLEQTESLIMNSCDKKIKEMLSENKLFIFTINSECYIIDDVTGEIVLYPFEEMEPEQGAEIFENDNKYIFIISENKLGKAEPKEIIKSILKGI